MGGLFYAVSRRRREVTLNNLRMAYKGEKNEAEIVEIAREVFRHFTREAFQFFYLLALSREKIDAMVDVSGTEHVDEALAEGNGCIVITAHYGNWELMARKYALLGYKVNVIARDSDDPGMTGIATRIRESGGYKVFDRDQPILGAFRCLKKNEVLGILPDQNESDGIMVEFFGRPVATAVGPAVLSLRSKAPLVPIFGRRISAGHYIAAAQPRIQFEPTGDEDSDISALTTLINKAIEEEIRTNPSQWLWMHDRWKSSPRETNNAL